MTPEEGQAHRNQQNGKIMDKKWHHNTEPESISVTRTARYHVSPLTFHSQHPMKPVRLHGSGVPVTPVAKLEGRPPLAHGQKKTTICRYLDKFPRPQTSSGLHDREQNTHAKC